MVGGLREDLEDVSHHISLCYVLIALNICAFKSSVEPHLHLPLLVDADLILVDIKESHNFSQLRKSPDADIKKMQDVRIRNVLDIRQPQGYSFDKDLILIM